MHVVVITLEYPPYRVGGLGTHCQELARGLVARGHRVEVISFCMEKEWTHEDDGITVHHLRFPFQDRMSVYDGRVAEIAVLSEKLTSYVTTEIKVTPDLIHSHEWIGYTIANPLLPSLACPIIVTMHGLWIDVLSRWSNHPEYNAITRLEAESCQQAQGIIAVSNSLKSRILQVYHLPRERIEVILNGCDGAIFERPSASTERTLWRRLKNAGRRIIVFAGRIGEQKGVLPLILSARLVRDQCRDVSYVIAGQGNDGPYLEAVTSAIERLHLKNCVHLVGKLSRSELADLYHHASLAAIPSNYEPFGYAASEAMFAGTPVIASAVDGLTEIIDHEINGLLVAFDAPDDRTFSEGYVKRLAAAQIRLLNDEVFAARLAARGRSRAQAAFAQSAMVDKTLSFYSRIVSEWQQSRSTATPHSGSLIPQRDISR